MISGKLGNLTTLTKTFYPVLIVLFILLLHYFFVKSNNNLANISTVMTS